jgi:outer membrane immunogenic protein
MRQIHSPMTRFPSIASVAIITISISPFSQAQEMPINWSGFYVGANAGALWANYNLSGFSESFSISNFTATTTGFSKSADMSFLGGGQIGYDQQFGSLVLGLEFDGDWNSQKASRSQRLQVVNNSFPFDIASLIAAHSVERDFNNAVRAKAGVSWARFLFYACGGLAFSDLTVRTRDTLFPQQNLSQGGLGSDSGIAAGWTAGGGTESSIIPAVSIAAEYRHVDTAATYNPSDQQLFRAHGHVDLRDEEVRCE